jgi:hypothetical protein
VFIGQGDRYLPVKVENMRIFDNTVIGAYQISNAISGDFNGDGIPDLISLRNESDFDWSATATQTKTGYVVVSHLNKGLANDQRTISSVLGTAADDFLQTTVHLPMLRGLAGNDVMQGRAGKVDTAIYHGVRNDFILSLQGDTVRIKDQQGNEGADQLLSIERISFSDLNIAFDLSANAGIVAKTLGAVFGKESVANKSFAGIGLHFVDDLNFSYPSLMELAINARLGANATNAQVVDLLYTNVVGQAPDAAARKTFTDLLDNGTFTVGGLGVLAADTELNKVNINLVGLAHSGLEFTPFSG